MLTFKADGNNDLTLGNDGNLAMISGLGAIIQQVEEVMETLKNELIYDSAAGIDYENTAWAGNPDLVKFERQARTQITNVENVESVGSFTVEIVGDVLTYEAIIETTLGSGTISNVV